MIELRRVRKRKETREFLEELRKGIYPELSKKEFRKWMEDEGVYAPLMLVAILGNEIVGGSVVVVQDHIDEKKVLLQLDAIWIKKKFQGQGYGQKLLKETFKEAKIYYQNHGLLPLGIMIQTTNKDGAVEFYKHSIALPYSMAMQEMTEVKIYVFVISF